jgi:hypothetical protein
VTTSLDWRIVCFGDTCVRKEGNPPMRNFSYLIVLSSLTLPACGSDKGTEPTAPPGGKTSSPTGAFTPPPLADGYTRFLAETVSGVAPGDDVTHCQYVMAPLAHDVDVVGVEGAQSKYGHHAVAFSYVPADGQEVGTEVPCMMDATEFSAGTMGGSSAASGTLGGVFLGAVGPDKGRGATLPEGVAFRLPTGQGIMLNLHYINTGTQTVDGDAYLDVKLVDPDPNRLIAALFLNLNGGFSLPPAAHTDSTADCVANSDVQIIMMSNHMHEYGVAATTEVVHGDTGDVEVLRDDPVWTADMVNNPPFSRWDAQSPFVLHTGDTIRTSCSWNNSTADTIGFPREMCISAGFALATGDTPTAPACFNGTWFGGSAGIAP